MNQKQGIEPIRDLASEVADGFNNLLTVIIGACTLLEKNAGNDPEQILYVDRIRNSADRAARLTQSLLEFGRNTQIVPTPADLAEVINEMLASLAGIIGNNLNISLELSEQPLMVMIDCSQIEAFFMNLIINFRAVTAVDDVMNILLSKVVNNGSLPELSRCEAGDYAMVTILDHRISMDRDALRRIFEPFVTTKVLSGEDGLELSASHGVINQHGGAVHIRSKPNQGTTLKIYLPLCDQDK